MEANCFGDCGVVLGKGKAGKKHHGKNRFHRDILDGQRNCELTGPVTSIILSQVLFRKMQEARQP